MGPAMSVRVSSASPAGMVARSPRPASSRLARAAVTLASFNSVPNTRSVPLSATAAARYRVEIPNEVPNSQPS